MEEQEYRLSQELDLSQEFSGIKKPVPRVLILMIPLILLLLAGSVLYFFKDSFFAPGQLRINEVVTSNKDCLSHELLGSPDFIELYNGSDKPIDLTGYGLSNSAKDSYKYSFPACTLQPGEYLLVFFAGGTGAAEDVPFTTDFGLSKDGDMVVLVDANYNMLDIVEIPPLPSDVSYARAADGSWGYCLLPTPDGINDQLIVKQLTEEPLA